MNIEYAVGIHAGHSPAVNIAHEGGHLVGFFAVLMRQYFFEIDVQLCNDLIQTSPKSSFGNAQSRAKLIATSMRPEVKILPNYRYKSQKWTLRISIPDRFLNGHEKKIDAELAD